MAVAALEKIASLSRSQARGIVRNDSPFRLTNNAYTNNDKTGSQFPVPVLYFQNLALYGFFDKLSFNGSTI